ncbi:hypothetical protein PW52_02215 [Tamlana sedimentorum]|uniref:Uncharacterized protein n=1 Tax=Neotamlana sedimentorum TaxID=1435349 RepID=A0A0D7WDW1_9FLAO|nr:hypothetical protein [Tamlana sedimentorum]KJD37259.1 hypothetical protein PW52_02215 [Tamlana sedimentorum]
MLKQIKFTTYKQAFLAIFCMLVVGSIGFAQSIPYSNGRIVISSDGNEHDHDDWAATPLSLALLAAKNLQENLTVYTFSDHIWGSNHDKSDGAKQMRISALKGKKIYKFKSTKFIEAVKKPEEAVQAISQQINISHKGNPLTIIAAGPMEVVGRAINASNPEALKFVRIISHSNWNNQHSDKPYNWEEHSGWTWNKIRTKFEPYGLICDRILDQNGGKDYEGLKAAKEKYDWIKTSTLNKKSKQHKKQLNWLYQRQLTCVKKGEFDPSDAGMIVYLLTGKQKTAPTDVRNIIENQ